MLYRTIKPDPFISLFVKNIWIIENTDPGINTNLPFFADGYPGLMFQETTANGLCIHPHKKIMPVLFIYGQTIHPIEMSITGPYRIIVFQLYPFVLKRFFNIEPQSINDNCYDLSQIKHVDISLFTKLLLEETDTSQRIASISNMLFQLFQERKQLLDTDIKHVIEKIITSKGQDNISTIAQQLGLNGRTLERRFLKETGLSPKKFAQIIQFQSSLEQLTVKNFRKLTDIVYENGFADQSHFIRVFKAFTGKTPKKFVSAA